MHVDVDLIQRYNRPLPRYTSYPTAPHFSTDVGPDTFVTAVEQSNTDASAGPLSLYVHLPFCKQLCYYCGCHMRVTHDPERIARYLSYLKREIDAVSAALHPEREVVQLHWGGGTPTYLSADQIGELGAHLRKRFRVADEAEISLEADPRTLTEAKVEAARRVGFNRISIGVQDLDPEVQEAINRVQPEAHVRDAIRWSREHGFQSINLDLVYGLPHQTVERFRPTVDAVIDMKPDRIALFNYAHVPQIKKHQRLIADDALPAPTEKLAIFKTALERLTAPASDGGGEYRFIGMDHFARPDDELTRAQDAGQLHRNFQGYSTRAGADVYAFGVSGIHQLTSLYAQNVKALDAYYERIDASHPTVFRGYALTPDDRLRRHVIMELMCHFRLEKAAVERWAEATLDRPIDFDACFADALSALEPLADDGLVTLHDDAIAVQTNGQLLIRNVAAAFDAYLKRPAAQQRPVYSQTV